MVKQKIILMAGGVGSRMGIFNPKRSKMLMEIDGKPLLEYVLEAIEGDLVVVTRPELVREIDPLLNGRDHEFIWSTCKRFRVDVANASKLCGDEFYVICSHQPIPRGFLERMSKPSLTGYDRKYNTDMIPINGGYAHSPYRLTREVVERMEEDGFTHKIERYIPIEKYGIVRNTWLPEADYPFDFMRLVHFMRGLRV